MRQSLVQRVLGMALPLGLLVVLSLFLQAAVESDLSVLTPPPRLTITKTDSDDPICPGGRLTYTLELNSNQPVTNVVVTDPLTPNVTLVSWHTTNISFTCSLNGSVVECTLPEMEQEETVTLVVDVDANATGTLSNTATVDSFQTDAVSDTVETEVSDGADLRIAKTAAPDPATAGMPLIYALAVTNEGPCIARDVSVTDILPEEVDYRDNDPSQGSFDPDTGTWSVYTLTRDATATLALVVDVKPAARGTLTNVAEVGSSVIDPDLGNNEVTVTTIVTTEADLEIVKSDSPDPVTAGMPLTYTLVVTNHGPSLATAVTVIDTLPLSVTFGSASPGQDSGPNPLVWVLGDLDPEGSEWVTVLVTPDAWISATLANTVTVIADELDPGLHPNTDTVTTSVKPLCEVLQLTDTPTDVANIWPTIGGLQGETRVAYLSDRTGNEELFVSTLGAVQNTQQATNSPPGVTNEFPAISGDGWRVAFVSDGDFDPDRANADGSDEVFVYDTSPPTFTNVTANSGSVFPGLVLAPSPDDSGGRIAFASDLDFSGHNPDVNLEIWMYDAASDQISQVTDSTQRNNTHVATSGDGQYLAFLSNGNLDARGGNEDGSIELFVARLGPGGVQFVQVTHTALGISIAHPSISYDGSRVAFLSNGDLVPAIGNSEGNLEIFVAELSLVAITGTMTLTQITDTDSGIIQADPALSGDGWTIAFVSNGALDSERGNADANPELYLAAVDSPGAFTQVTATGPNVTNSAPSINRLGTQIAFVSDGNLRASRENPEGNREVFVASCLLGVDLSVKKTTATRWVAQGQPITYAIVIRSDRGGVGTPVTVTDTLATSVDYLPGSVMLPGGSCSDWQGGTLVCSMASLAPGATATLTLVITPENIGVITNTASVAGSPSIPDPKGNNKSSVVLRPPRLLYLPIVLRGG